MKNSNHFLVAAVLGLALALTGCGGDEATPTPAPSPEPAQATAAVSPTSTPVSKLAVPAVSAGNGSQPLASPLNSPLQAAGVAGAVPTERGVWNTTVSTDNMTGDCKASVLPVYGLVQITPQGETLEWKSQEPQPYTMKQSSPNQFQYVGPTVTKDGTVTMTVTFVDAKNLTMSRDFVATDAPGCNHHHDYTGVFQWNK